LLPFFQLFQVLNERLYIQLEVELEARDDRRDVIELIQLVLEIVIDEGVANILALELANESGHRLPFVHHFLL